MRHLNLFSFPPIVFGLKGVALSTASWFCAGRRGGWNAVNFPPEEALCRATVPVLGPAMVQPGGSDVVYQLPAFMRTSSIALAYCLGITKL